jgi:hypothetical protein
MKKCLFVLITALLFISCGTKVADDTANAYNESFSPATSYMAFSDFADPNKPATGYVPVQQMWTEAMSEFGGVANDPHISDDVIRINRIETPNDYTAGRSYIYYLQSDTLNARYGIFSKIAATTMDIPSTSGNFAVNGKLNVSDTVRAGKPILAASGITATGLVTANGGLTVNSGATLSSLSVTGDIGTAANITAANVTASTNVSATNVNTTNVNTTNTYSRFVSSDSLASLKTITYGYSTEGYSIRGASKLGVFRARSISGSGYMYYCTKARGSRNTYKIQISNTSGANPKGWSCYYVTFYTFGDRFSITDGFVTRLGYNYGTVTIALSNGGYVYIILGNLTYTISNVQIAVDLEMSEQPNYDAGDQQFGFMATLPTFPATYTPVVQ